MALNAEFASVSCRAPTEVVSGHRCFSRTSPSLLLSLFRCPNPTHPGGGGEGGREGGQGRREGGGQGVCVCVCVVGG